MTQPRIENAQNIVKAAKCCLAQKVIDINKKRRKTLRSNKLDKDYDEAFWMQFYIEAIESEGHREQLGDLETSNIMDRISELCEC